MPKPSFRGLVPTVSYDIHVSVEFRQALFDDAGDPAEVVALIGDVETMRPIHGRGRRAQRELATVWRTFATQLGVIVPDPAPRCALVDCVATADSPLFACAACLEASCASVPLADQAYLFRLLAQASAEVRA